MPKIFSQAEINKIVFEIKQWPHTEKITWNNICIRAKKVLGCEVTRQALSSKSAIKKAYQEKIKKENQVVATGAPDLRVLRKHNLYLQNERLKIEYEQMKSAFERQAVIINRIIYNASLKNLSKDYLLNPLPALAK